MLLNDQQIEQEALDGMIHPFINHKVRKDYTTDEPIISYGLSSSGYDLRLGEEFYEGPKEGILDPKNAQGVSWRKFKSIMPFELKPGHFILGESVEYIEMPTNIMGVVVGKSTYARCGIDVLVTPIEPGWRGILTIEIANLGKTPVLIYPNQGICQVMFHNIIESKNPYGDGKYQNQTGVTKPKI